MRFFDLLAGLWYEALGRRVPRVGVEIFAPCLADVLKSLVPSHQIQQSAGIDLKQEWTPSLEEEIINVHVAHLLGKWQPAHNSLQDMKPERQYRSLHMKAMMASRAYGETVFTYIEYKRLFLSPLYLTKTYYKKQRDGRQLDALARQYAHALLDELERIRVKEPQKFGLLVPSDDAIESVEDIAAEKPEFFPQILRYAVAPF